MTKRKRLLFLLACIALFFLVAPILALYSQGYKFDFEKKKFVETGGFYIQTFNTPARIYIDGKFRRKTGLLQNATFIKNFIPDNYQIKVSQDGFYSWEKILPVYSQKVTEVKNIFLLKKDLRFNLLAENIEEYLISQDKKEILLKTRDDNGWLIIIISLENQEKRVIIDQEYFENNFQDKEPSLEKWDKNNKRILLSYSEKELAKYLMIKNYDGEDKKVFLLDNLPENSENISLNPDDSQALLFLRENTVFRLEDQGKEASPLVNNVVSYEIKNGEIIWLSKSGFVYRSSYLGETKEVINNQPFLLQEENDYKIDYYRSDIFFLRENKDLYFLKENGSFEKIFQDIKGLALGLDQSQVAFWSDNELWVLDLIPEERESYYQEKITNQEYKKIFLNRFSKKIGDCLWLTPYHLVFNVENNIKISEIDARDGLNVFDLPDFKNPFISFDNERDKLLVISEGNLFLFESILN